MAARRKSKEKRAERARSRPQQPRPTKKVAAALAVLAILAGGLYALRAKLLASPPYSQLLARVRFSHLPSWMPDDIAQELLAQIQSAAAGRSVFEGRLARDVYKRAVASPWVARVERVTKHGDGAVVVEAEYRRPFALVRSAAVPANRLIVVGEDAVVRPVPGHRIKPHSLITIGDVASRPPAPGGKWDASDLTAGLRLLKLIKSKPYAREITWIDVRNYDGRISPSEPHLRLKAQLGRGRPTDVRFGRFPRGDDYVVSPQRKLAYLDKYYQDHGDRLAGFNAYLDLRYDKLHVSVN